MEYANKMGFSARQRSETQCKSSQAVVSRQPPIGDELAASISGSHPIESLWEIVNRRINREGVRIKDQLFEQIQKAWAAIPQSFIDHLIESMPRRCKAVIDNKGFATKY